MNLKVLLEASYLNQKEGIISGERLKNMSLPSYAADIRLVDRIVCSLFQGSGYDHV